LIFSHKSTIHDFDFNIVNHEIESFCGLHVIPAALLYTIQLIVEELVTNTIKYGKCADGNEIIKIEIIIDENSTTLIIADNTEAFNPLEAEEPDIDLSVEEREIGGLGLVLVKQKARSLSYEFVDGFNIVKAII